MLDKKVVTIVLWASLLIALLPLRLARSEERTASYLIAATALLVATLVFLLEPSIARLARKLMIRSWHLWSYILALTLSQFINVFFGKELGLSDFFWSFGYSIFAVCGFIVFAAAVARGLFDHWQNLMLTVGVFSSAIAIYVGVTGATSLFGMPIFWNISKQMAFYAPWGVYLSSSIWFEANRFAMVAFCGCMGALYFLTLRKHVVLNSINFVICSLGVALSWSRAVYGALVLALVVFAILNTASIRQKIRVSVLSVALVGVLAIMLSRSSLLYDAVYGYQGMALRDILWPATINAIKNSPWWGYGVGGVSVSRVEDLLYLWSGVPLAVHSTPLGIGLSYGIPAILLWFGLYIVSAYRLLRSNLAHPQKAVLAAGISGWFVATVFLDYVVGGLSYITFVQGIFLGLANAAPWIEKSVVMNRAVVITAETGSLSAFASTTDIKS